MQAVEESWRPRSRWRRSRPGRRSAQAGKVSDEVVRIGVLADMTGIYSDLSGKGAVEAVRMAVEDYGGKVLGKPIEVIHADHQNKPDIGSNIARQWFDTGGVDLIQDLSNSAVALAVAAIAKEKKRHIVVNGSSNMGITNQACSPYAVHYAYDAYSLAHGTGGPSSSRAGTAGSSSPSTSRSGTGSRSRCRTWSRPPAGASLGSARHPLNTTDFSSFLLQAQASKAKIIGVASTGADAINAIKGAAEFGLTKNQKLAALLLWINDVHALGLETARGLQLTNAWYWDMNDETRAFAKRYFARVGSMPNMSQAADYSSTTALPEGGRGGGHRRSRRRLEDDARDCRSTTCSPRAARSARTAAWSTTCTCGR